MDDVVRDAVMLGVAAIQPIVTTRTETTVAALTAGRAARALAARRAGVGEAVAPRRAARDPHAADARDVRSASRPPRCALMLVEPAAAADVEPLVGAAARRRRRPTPRCSSDRKAGGRRRSGRRRPRTASASMTLGPRTLRADAVPVAAISVLQFLWDEL